MAKWLKSAFSLQQGHVVFSPKKNGALDFFQWLGQLFAGGTYSLDLGHLQRIPTKCESLSCPLPCAPCSLFPHRNLMSPALTIHINLLNYWVKFVSLFQWQIVTRIDTHFGYNVDGISRKVYFITMPNGRSFRRLWAELWSILYAIFSLFQSCLLY